MQWLQALNELKLPPLIQGNHPDGPEHGMCAMEMISYMEQQPFSDNPEGVCEVLRGLTITINDTLNDNDRQKLMPVLPELVDTVVDQQHREKRSRFIMDFAHRSAEWHLRGREYDYERDRFRGTGYGHHQMEKIHSLLSQGVAGAFTLIKELTPPWQLADVMIGMLRDCIKIGTPKPRHEFKKPQTAKKLAEVVYLPVSKRKSGQNLAMASAMAEMPTKFKTEMFHSMPVLKHTKIFADVTA